MIRELSEADHEAVRQIHSADGFDYPAPDLADPLFVRAFACEDEKGFRGALAARLTMEMYLFLAPGTPEERWNNFLELHEEMKRELKKMGIGEVHCFLPPEIVKSFGKRLESLGWIREWEPYRFELDGVLECESIT